MIKREHTVNVMTTLDSWKIGRRSTTTTDSSGRSMMSHIIQRLRSFPIVPEDGTASQQQRQQQAAVLVGLCINPRSGECEVLLTLRSRRLRSHAGEVSLPGGRRDEDDRDLVFTACREAQEEIGLDPARVSIINSLPTAISKNGLIVTPIIATIPFPVLPVARSAVAEEDAGRTTDLPVFTPQPNPDEVDSIFTCPLRRFLSSEDYHFMDIPGLNGGVWRGHWFNHTAEDGIQYRIWGLTAAILINVSVLAFQRMPDFQFSPPPEVVAHLSSQKTTLANATLEGIVSSGRETPSSGFDADDQQNNVDDSTKNKL